MLILLVDLSFSNEDVLLCGAPHTIYFQKIRWLYAAEVEFVDILFKRTM